MVLLHRKLNFSKDPEGVQHFQGGGVQLFSRGVQMLISKETHITCDFPGGPDPLSPSGSAHDTLKNFPIHFPFDISLLPCPWTYPLAMLHTCTLIYKSKGGCYHDLARIRDRLSSSET